MFQNLIWKSPFDIRAFKVGIIGFGTIAKRHLAEINNLCPACQILIRSRQDIKKINLPEAAQFTASINEVVELRPNIIIVASPASEHANQIHDLHKIPTYSSLKSRLLPMFLMQRDQYDRQ